MQKKFKKWHERKSGIHEFKQRPYFHERELWFASVGANVGYEQDGKGEQFLRPLIILKKFNNEVLWGIPTTRKSKKGIYYFNFKYSKTDTTTAILSQLRLVDSKRLEYLIGTISDKDFEEMKKRIISLLE